MPRANGRKLLMQLIAAYREEGRLYNSLDRAATEQRSLLKNGRHPRRLAELVDRQRLLAEQIGKIETAITPLRGRWEQMRDSVRDTNVKELAERLDSLLENLAEHIHHILEIEKDSSAVLVGAMSAG